MAFPIISPLFLVLGDRGSGQESGRLDRSLLASFSMGPRSYCTWVSELSGTPTTHLPRFVLRLSMPKYTYHSTYLPTYLTYITYASITIMIRARLAARSSLMLQPDHRTQELQIHLRRNLAHTYASKSKSLFCRQFILYMRPSYASVHHGSSGMSS